MSVTKILKLIILALVLVNLAIHRDSRLEERKHTKYFQIDKSAEAHRADIEKAYAYWGRETGIKFIERYKPFRTVVISGSTKAHSPEKSVVGRYHIRNKKITIFKQSDFYNIVLHEIGHSIGIPHNDNYYDVMYPTTGLNKITPSSLLDLKKAMHKRYYLIFY